MNFNELACLMSHIKAIESASEEAGDFFIICEDDAEFTMEFERKCEEVINNCVEFDILLLHKTFPIRNLSSTYCNWNKMLKYNNVRIASCVCYVISRSGIKKVLNSVTRIDDKIKFSSCKNLQSDWYIYSQCDTYVYKYNLIKTGNDDSDIHTSHLKSNRSVEAENLQYLM